MIKVLIRFGYVERLAKATGGLELPEQRGPPSGGALLSAAAAVAKQEQDGTNYQLKHTRNGRLG